MVKTTRCGLSVDMQELTFCNTLLQKVWGQNPNNVTTPGHNTNKLMNMPPLVGRVTKETIKCCWELIHQVTFGKI